MYLVVYFTYKQFEINKKITHCILCDTEMEAFQKEEKEENEIND